MLEREIERRRDRGEGEEVTTKFGMTADPVESLQNHLLEEHGCGFGRSLALRTKSAKREKISVSFCAQSLSHDAADLLQC